MLRLLALTALLLVGAIVWHIWPWSWAGSTALWQWFKNQADPIQSLEASAALLVLLTGAVWRLLRRKPLPSPPPVQGSIVNGNVQADTVVGRDQTIIHIQYGKYEGEPPGNDEEALAIYREVLACRCGDIPLSGLDREADDASSRYRPLALERVYVDLDTETRASAKAIDTALSQNQPLAFDLPRQEKADDIRALAAWEAAALHSRLELLGAPGSGKTTFVNRLCLGLAKQDWAGLERWPKALRDGLPLLVVLRDFARWLDGQDKPEPGAKLLWDFIAHDLTARNLAAAAKPLKKALEQGHAWVFFDGLDEVPVQRRHCVLQSLQGFSLSYQKSRLLVTCRTATHEQKDWRLPADFAVFRVAPFDDGKIRRFVEAWYEEMALRWNQPLERSRELAAKLNDALRRPDMARLAPNPLLLTVMALVHTHDKELPDYRAVLYERCVAILLWRWERRKQDHGEELELMDRLRQAGCSDKDLLRVLWRLAYEAHATGGLGGDPEQVAGLDDMVLIKALSGLHPGKSLDWAKDLVELMRQRTGLLVEREPGVFAFPHRTFQEYLAGVHLATGANFTSSVNRLAEQGAAWREVILLAVGYRVHERGDYDPILELVRKLCPPTETCEGDMGWRKIRLAGEAVLEMGVERFARQDGGTELLNHVRLRLADLLEQGRLTPEERLPVGETLGSLGDPRFDPAKLGLPCLYRRQPESHGGFVEIPAGPFWMGSERGDKEARDNEFGNPNPLDLPYRYGIARYPVTVAQFDAFVRAGGYREHGCWTTEAARAWLQKSRQAAPYDWDAQRLHPNRPAVNVTWFEAMAYAAWLDRQLRLIAPGWIPAGYTVRLPTEAEWEKAARHADRRRYPWGDEDWEPQRANIDRSKVGHASPVGAYPLGATPAGLHDIAGNVWEWNLTAWGEYPYQPARNNPDGDKTRVARGGSWVYDGRASRCAYRDRLYPDDGGYNLGFRLVVSLALDS